METVQKKLDRFTAEICCVYTKKLSSLLEQSPFNLLKNYFKTGFTELTASSPDFIEDLLESLKSEASTGDFYTKAQKCMFSSISIL